MTISVFDMFKIGIGPSSSHTVGPMRAARMFMELIRKEGKWDALQSVSVELYGSLAYTGKGHGTDRAVFLGLEGEDPEHVNPDTIEARWAALQTSKSIKLLGEKPLAFDPIAQINFVRKKTLPFHSNGMKFFAYSKDGKSFVEKVYYSVGGGFVVDEQRAKKDQLKAEKDMVYPFKTAAELLAICDKEKLTIAQVILANEKQWRTEDEIYDRLKKIWGVMEGCIERGCKTEGILPGKLKVKRRAPDLFSKLSNRPAGSVLTEDNLKALDWVNMYAIAVNEENASGSRVVTAPTNGAAGIIPAVVKYYKEFCLPSDEAKIYDFLLTSAAIGILYTLNASISGAEVGCQGEVGVACSMAAGGLVAAKGGSMRQVEQAAEIGMEHNLGLTCDPIGGLVQIPCIERNAMGAVKAINAARIALSGDGTHYVSLDSVIKTMKETGKDMMTKYKETSRGGLAVNVIEC
ncbi:MAG: L-serine ammonia-lyase [Oligoflexales bacterium]